MEHSRRRDCRKIEQEVSRSRTLPYSCLEIPDAILPVSSAATGFIIAADSWSQGTVRGASCERRCAGDLPSAPLRVLWLPPASLLPEDSSPDEQVNVVRRLLLQTDVREGGAAATPSAKTGENYTRASVLRLARHARLALDVLAGGYRIAGVWLRTDLGEDELVKSVVYKPNSFLRSLAYAIAKANASSLRVSLNPERAAEICCCFVLFSHGSGAGNTADGGKEPVEVLGYYSSGSTAATLEFHQLPVVIRQAGYLQRDKPLTQNLVYSTRLPAQVELCLIANELVVLSTHATRQQLCAALASELYATIVTVFSPPVLASALLSKPCVVPQSVSHAQHEYSIDSFMLKDKVFFRCRYHKGPAHCTCTLPQKVTEKLLSNTPTNSALPIYSGNLGSSRQQDYVWTDSCADTRARQPMCTSVVLTSLSQCLRDDLYGHEDIAEASSSPLCSLQPLQVGDLVFRYRIFRYIPPEEACEDKNSGVLLQVQPWVGSNRMNRESLSDSGTAETFSAGLSHMSCPLIHCVKNEFIAAIVAPVNASLESLRKALAADAAAAIARRVVDSLAHTSAAHSHWKTKQRTQKPGDAPDNEQQGLSQNLGSLEVRRFYTVCLVGTRQSEEKSENVVTALLLNDFDNPGHTEDAALQAAVERFEILLGIPPSSVVIPRTCLRDGNVILPVCAAGTEKKALVAHGRDHQRAVSESSTNVTKKHSVLSRSSMQSTPADVFWNNLESRVRKKGILQSGARAGKASARGQRHPGRILWCACMLLLAVALIARLLFPPTTRTDKLDIS